MPSSSTKAKSADRGWTIGISGALFALNAFVCRELFVTEYTRHLASIEGAYIGISRYLMEHPFEWGWFPLWYGGIPFQNGYPPLLHFLVAGAAWLLDISPALAHHAVTAALYCLGPCGLFLFAYALTGSRLLSVAVAVVYSMASPATAVSASVASWAAHFWNPARLQALLIFGDGPHIASVALIPLALLVLHHALEKTTPVRVFAAAGS